MLGFQCYVSSCIVMQIPWEAGAEVVALYKFPGNSPEDLSFRRGDILTIVHSCAVRVRLSE